MIKTPSSNQDRDGNAGDSDGDGVCVCDSGWQPSGGWQASGGWWLVATEMVENDIDGDTEWEQNVGRVKGGFLYNYFVRWVYVLRCHTAHSHPCKLTSTILVLPDVEKG